MVSFYPCKKNELNIMDLHLRNILSTWEDFKFYLPIDFMVFITTFQPLGFMAFITNFFKEFDKITPFLPISFIKWFYGFYLLPVPIFIAQTNFACSILFLLYFILSIIKQLMDWIHMKVDIIDNFYFCWKSMNWYNL